MNYDNNYLMHYKYIRKTKVNGKWRYYYKDDKKSDSQPQVSSEYAAEVEFNSKKNNYSGGNDNTANDKTDTKSASSMPLYKQLALSALATRKTVEIGSVAKSSISRGLAAVEKIFKRSKKSTSKKPQASSDYLKEVEYNSQKNSYKK